MQKPIFIYNIQISFDFSCLYFWFLSAHCHPSNSSKHIFVAINFFTAVVKNDFSFKGFYPLVKVRRLKNKYYSCISPPGAVQLDAYWCVPADKTRTLGAICDPARFHFISSPFNSRIRSYEGGGGCLHWDRQWAGWTEQHSFSYSF